MRFAITSNKLISGHSVLYIHSSYLANSVYMNDSPKEQTSLTFKTSETKAHSEFPKVARKAKVALPTVFVCDSPTEVH